MTTPVEYSSNALQVASDATYAALGDAYDGTVVRPATDPSLATLKQGSRPARQMAARIRNWIDREFAKVLTALIGEMAYVKGAFDPATNGTRLSISATESVPLTEGPASTLYIVRHTSASIALYDQATDQWYRRDVTGAAGLALSGLTAGQNYDVFAYWTGTAVALELGAAWGSDTVAPTMTIADGVAVKGATSALKTRRLVGSIRATSATQTEDSEAKRFLWNEYNQVRRTMLFTTATASWAYSGTTVRQANGQTGTSSYRYEFLCRRAVSFEASLFLTYQAVAANITGFALIGLDSTASQSFNKQAFSTGSVAGYNVFSMATYSCMAVVGYHAVNWLESTSGGSGVTFIGTNSALRGTLFN